ncbi:hypothetical protein ACLMJK_008629 [Lecanora helva]
MERAPFAAALAPLCLNTAKLADPETTSATIQLSFKTLHSNPFSRFRYRSALAVAAAHTCLKTQRRERLRKESPDTFAEAVAGRSSPEADTPGPKGLRLNVSPSKYPRSITITIERVNNPQRESLRPGRRKVDKPSVAALYTSHDRSYLPKTNMPWQLPSATGTDQRRCVRPALFMDPLSTAVATPHSASGEPPPERASRIHWR